jgi:hypothetical protein
MFVVAKPAVVPAAKPVTAPAAPRTTLVDAEGKTYTPVVLPSSKPAPEEQAEGSKDDASHQGIHVHGHWIIDVHNVDGTLAEHRDFQNSLVGTSDMVGLVYGSFVPSDFAVYLEGSTSPCNATSPYACGIVHNLSVLPASAICQAGYYVCATTLTVTPAFGGFPTLVLAGNLTATQAGSVNTVGTYIGLCGSPTSTLATVSAASCAAGNSPYAYGVLTQAGITALNVAQGQVISVTVTISFA